MDLFTRHRRAGQRWRRDARTGAIHGANFKSQLCKSFDTAGRWCFDVSPLFGVTFPSWGCLRLLLQVVHGAQRLACAVCHRNVLTGARGTNMCCTHRASFTAQMCSGICTKVHADSTGYDKNTLSGVLNEESCTTLAPRSGLTFDPQGNYQIKSDAGMIVCIAILFRLNLKRSPCGCALTRLALCPHASHQGIIFNANTLLESSFFFNVGADFASRRCPF